MQAVFHGYRASKRIEICRGLVLFMRKLIYVSGTRADYGLMSHALRLWDASNELDVSVCVTGMHLLDEYGYTINEIRQDKIRICGEVFVDLSSVGGAAMARAIARALEGMIDVFLKESPDMVVLLGDRGEMIAGALAAIHLNIPIVHIHGGELSGTVDEPIRHAISKLSHYHFTSTQSARERLIKMGERAEHIFVVGAPGLDNLVDTARFSRQALCNEVGFSVDKKVILLVFHPVLQSASEAAIEVKEIFKALKNIESQVLWLLPNADAGGHLIRQEIEKFSKESIMPLHVAVHLPREKFVSWMKHADVMLGNSSSGIIEAATFGTPVVNIGVRQRARERSSNVVDVDIDEKQINEAVLTAFERGRQAVENVYGTGNSGEKMLTLLKNIPISQDVLEKLNAY